MRERIRERERQRDHLRERERPNDKRKERQPSSARVQQGVEASKVNHRSRNDQHRCGVAEVANTELMEDDGQRNSHANQHEGQWIQVTGRRKASLKSGSTSRGGSGVLKHSYQRTEIGRLHRVMWRDRLDITSFYFSHFPDGTNEKDLWKKFQEWGRVREVFIPQKKNKIGHRYGFVRFKGVEDVASLERRLDNNIYIQGMKLFVNQPKFHRGGSRAAKPFSDPHNRLKISLRVPDGPEQKAHQVPTSTRLKSYVEVVKQSNNVKNGSVHSIPGKELRVDNVEPISIQTSPEKLKWLDNAWVGGLKNKGMFDRVDMEVQGAFGLELKTAYWGDDKIIIYDMDDDTANQLIHDEQQHGGTPFYSFQRWSPAMEPSHRLTWVCIWGVPLKAWDAENLARIVSAFGDLVELDAMTEERSRVDIARVLIRTEDKLVIDGTVMVVVDGTHYRMKLREEFGSQWGNRSWSERLDRLPTSPFSMEMAGSPGDGHMHGARSSISGSPLSLSTTWLSPCTEERRGSWRPAESYLRCDRSVNPEDAHVSHQACQRLLPTFEELTPGIGGQQGGNCSQPRTLHENGRTEPTSPRPRQQQHLLREEDVGDKAKIASDHVRPKEGDPLDNNSQALFGVKLGSYEGDSAVCKGNTSTHILGLGGTGPNNTRTKVTSPLKVYVRKKGRYSSNLRGPCN